MRWPLTAKAGSTPRLRPTAACIASMPDGHAEVYCSPGETYIWAMTFGKDGSLYLATGDHGKILRVAPTDSTPAKAETYFETKETNITALAWDKDGNLLAGTSPHGYLYRIDKANHGFVVFNSGDKEIKQIAVAPDGIDLRLHFCREIPSRNRRPGSSSGHHDSISADGRRRQSQRQCVQSRCVFQCPACHCFRLPADDGRRQPSSARHEVGGSARPANRAQAEPSQGAIYRIDTNGFYERYWSAPAGEAIYSMILLPDGNLLAGTGDKGRIYSVADANHWKLLQKTSDGAQVAALLPDSGESKGILRRHQPSRRKFTGSIFHWRKAAPTRPRRLTRNKKACGANCIPTATFLPAPSWNFPPVPATRRSRKKPGATGPSRSR